MQPPSSAAALQSLTDYNTNRQSAQDIQTQADNQYDLPGYNSRLSTIRGLVGNLQSSVDAVDPSVTGRTSGSFVTEGQRSALVNKEQAPILSNLAKENTALSTEQAGQQNAQSLASQMASAITSQDQTKYQSLLDQYNGVVAAEAATEQKREFDANLAQQQAAAKAAASASSAGGYDLSSLLNSFNPQPAATLTGGKTKDDAQSAVQALIGTKNNQLILNTINAIAKSAGYGNTYDQAKLELLQSLGYGVKGTSTPLTLNGTGKGTSLISSNGLTF